MLCPKCSMKFQKRAQFCPSCGHQFTNIEIKNNIEKGLLANPKPSQISRYYPAHLTTLQRYLFTALLIAFYITLSRLSIYTIPTSLPSMNTNANHSIYLFAIGLTPFFNGFVLVELLSFVLPPLSLWRQRGLAGRIHLNTASLVVSFVLVAKQAWSNFGWLSVSNSVVTSNLIPYSGMGQRFQAALWLILGSVIAYSLAKATSRFGILNGFLVYLFIKHVVNMSRSFLDIYSDFTQQGNFEMSFDEKMNVVFVLIALLGLVTLSAKILPRVKAWFIQYTWLRPTLIYKSPNAQYAIAGSPLPQTLSLGLNVTLYGVWLIQYVLLKHLDYGVPHLKWLERSASIADYFVIALILGWLFTRPFWVDHQLEGRANWSTGRLDSLKYFRFWIAVGVGTKLYEEFFKNIPFQLWSSNSHIAAMLHPIRWFTLIILGREIYENLIFIRQKQNLICLAEMDNVSMVQLWTAQFDRLKIKHHMEGLRYRQITQFFAPYVKIRVWVEASQAKKALRVMSLDRLKQV